MGSSRSRIEGSLIERAGDGQAALHAARQRLDLVGRALQELDELEQPVGLLPRLRARHPEVARVDHEVVADRELGVERVLLRDDAQPAADARAVDVRVEVEDPERARGHRRHAADHPHRARLAGAVRPEEAEALAGLRRRSRCASTAVNSPNFLVSPRAWMSGVGALGRSSEGAWYPAAPGQNPSTTGANDTRRRSRRLGARTIGTTPRLTWRWQWPTIRSAPLRIPIPTAGAGIVRVLANALLVLLAIEVVTAGASGLHR